MQGCRREANEAARVGAAQGCALLEGALPAARPAGHYGAYLTGKQDWPLLRRIVSSLATGLRVPVTCKARAALADSVAKLAQTAHPQAHAARKARS